MTDGGSIPATRHSPSNRSTGLVTLAQGAVVASVTIGTSAGPIWSTGVPSSTEPKGSMFTHWAAKRWHDALCPHERRNMERRFGRLSYTEHHTSKGPRCPSTPLWRPSRRSSVSRRLRPPRRPPSLERTLIITPRRPRTSFMVPADPDQPIDVLTQDVTTGQFLRPLEEVLP